jgi:pilus assembly protein CpaE
MSAVEDLMGSDNTEQSAVECIAFVGDNQTHGVVSNVLGEQFVDPVIRDGSTAQVIEYLSDAQPPGILIVDLSDSASPLTAIMSLTAALSEDTRIIGIGAVNDITLYREIVDAGATDYVVKPVTEKALTLALQRVNEPAAGTAAPQEIEHKQERIAVIGSRGGVGVSTVATNVAWYYGQELNNKTVLVDLDLEFGTVALSLDLEPTRGLREALENPSRIDSLFISSATAKLTDNLSVMATEETLAEDLHFNPNAVDILFETIGRNTDAIVIDVPRSSFSVRQKALEAATKIIVVTEITLSGLRDCIRILASAEDAAPQTPIFVIANRAGSQGQAMPISEFQKAIGRKIDFQIPEDSKALNTAANNGKPLLQQDRRGKASKAIEKIASQLGGVKNKVKKDKEKKPNLGKLFKRK